MLSATTATDTPPANNNNQEHRVWPLSLSGCPTCCTTELLRLKLYQPINDQTDAKRKQTFSHSVTTKYNIDICMEKKCQAHPSASKKNVSLWRSYWNSASMTRIGRERWSTLVRHTSSTRSSSLSLSFTICTCRIIGWLVGGVGAGEAPSVIYLSDKKKNSAVVL